MKISEVDNYVVLESVNDFDLVVNAFPIGTWIKKAQSFYSGDMQNYGQYAGIYQQYIFYYARRLKI